MSTEPLAEKRYVLALLFPPHINEVIVGQRRKTVRAEVAMLRPRDFDCNSRNCALNNFAPDRSTILSNGHLFFFRRIVKNVLSIREQISTRGPVKLLLIVKTRN